MSIIVPVKDDSRKNAWIFTKPLKTELWITMGASFLYTGIVIWILEHRVNTEFRGPPRKQVGMIFWFSFSTLVFAHSKLSREVWCGTLRKIGWTKGCRFKSWFAFISNKKSAGEKVMSYLTRFILTVWVFVVLVLSSSYTASLTSLLAVQQLQPTATGINDLIKRGGSIGCQEGSFTCVLLGEYVGKSRLQVLRTSQDYTKALSNGSVSAILDELPYLRLVLSMNCSNSKFKMVGPTNRTAGLGFVSSPSFSNIVSHLAWAPLRNLIWIQPVLFINPGISQGLPAGSWGLKGNPEGDRVGDNGQHQ